MISNLKKNFALNLILFWRTNDRIRLSVYQKFSRKFKDDISVLEKESAQMASMSSNLEKAVARGLKMAENIGLLWENSKFEAKQKLQYLMFSEGIIFNKEKGRVRTNRVNSLFAAIPLLARDLEERENKKPANKSLLASNVENSGFEPLTSCMLCRYVPHV